MTQKRKPVILVAPLDWGLGHASRCIPVIHELLNIGCCVILAGEGSQRQLLLLEFPDLEFVDLRGYRIDYTRSKRFFTAKILFQVPKILHAIKREQNWIKYAVQKHKIDAIISDNRFGLYHPYVPSIFITHQLSIKAPGIVEKWIQIFNYRYIRKFSGCWVPDVKGSPNLAGELSHPFKVPNLPLTYIGGISRFDRVDTPEHLYDILVVISGPEPQRSMLEKKLLRCLHNYQGKVLFVRGLPGVEISIPSFNQVSVVNHLDATELNRAFVQSNLVISRSGYTTVMDILKLRKKSILVPTPGQTEQEYLAIHLQKQQWCLAINQAHFTLANALEQAAVFSYNLPFLNMNLYKAVVNEFAGSLNLKATQPLPLPE